MNRESNDVIQGPLQGDGIDLKFRGNLSKHRDGDTGWPLVTAGGALHDLTQL